MKKCVGCRNNKPVGEFYNKTSSPDGLHPYCKQCCKVNKALEGIRRRDKKIKISVRQLYRAKKAGIKYDETITLVEVFRRARGMCAECGEWVQPRHASMDHITPITYGGEHTWQNIQLTHFLCNLRKGTSLR